MTTAQNDNERRPVEWRTTHQLQVGDIIHDHGARFLIDQPILPAKNPGSDAVYTHALLLGPIPGMKVEAQVASFVRQDGGRWIIAGNGRARWAVEQ